MEKIVIKIDGIDIETEIGNSVLKACDNAGIYIPRLCYHPALPPWEKMDVEHFIYRGTERIQDDSFNTISDERIGCRLCIVEVEGMNKLVRACVTPVEFGMKVRTDIKIVQEKRKVNLSKILATHPHVCLSCAQKEGCDRIQCSMNVPVEERCCSKFGNCEVQRVSEYIGILEDTPRYIPRKFPLIQDEPLFTRNYELCIGCTRCIRACKDLRGIDALGFVIKRDEVFVGSVSTTLKESGCKFCTACVEVCPTGTLMDKKLKFQDRSDGLVPCRAGCPARTDVPRYVKLVGERKLEEALAVVRERVPFPGVLGHICFHPCEDVCRRGEINEPISICAIKRFASEYDNGNWKNYVKHHPSTGKRIAIIGAGPCGLSAAYYLKRKGHEVTIFEAMPEPGGMLRFGIPEFRLSRKVLTHEINEILSLGIELKNGVSLGRDFSLDDLRKQGFDAILLSVGASQSKKIYIDGIELSGVVWGLEFLRSVNLGEEIKVGKKVVVIGGGNVAMDVALMSFRLGADEVDLACLESRDEMPAYKHEIQKVIEEGVRIYNSLGPKKIIGNGDVNNVELVRCKSVFDESGNFNPSFDDSLKTILEAETVILAIGQKSDLSFLGNTEIVFDKYGRIVVDECLRTNVDAVFAGGDVASGPKSVIAAIAHGRMVSASIDKFLGGDGNIDEQLIDREPLNPWLGREDDFVERRRAIMPCLTVEDRKRSFAEIELGLSEKSAIEEGRRCLQCELRLHIPPLLLPPFKEKKLLLEMKFVQGVPEKEGVYQLLNSDSEILYIAGTINLRKSLLEQLEKNSRAKYFVYEEAPMFTKRESELIQNFLQKYGKMPEFNDELGELF